MVRVISELLRNDRRAIVLMLVLVLNDTIDLLAMANNVHWYGHALRRMVMSWEGR